MSKPRAASAPAAHGDAGARKRSASPTLFRRAAAAITALMLGAGLALVGVAAPASAHTGDLKANAVCNTATGEYDVTYTLKLTNVPNNKTGTTKWRVGDTDFDGTPKSAANMDRGPISTDGNGTIELGTEHLAGDTQGYGPWVYAYTTWPGADKGSDGRLTTPLAGDCAQTGPVVKKIEFCHATGSETHPYERIETAVEAFFNAGHDAHQNHGDIYPAFSYLKHGKVIHVPAQGDQSLLQYEDCVKPAVEIPVEGAPTFSDACGPDNEVLNLPGDTEKIDWNAVEAGSIVTVTATAKPGYAFEKNAKTTWTFTVDDAPCVVPVVGAPSFQDTCGADNEKLTVPADTDTIDWNSSEAAGVITVTATAKPGSVFPEGATRVWTFTVNDAPCVIDVVGTPGFSDTCGPDNELLVLPEDTTTIDWSSLEANGVITVTATAKLGYAFPEGARTVWEFPVDDAPCVIDVVGVPTFADTCGPDNEKLTIPEDTTTIDWDSTQTNGVITVTATAKPGSTFPKDAKSVWTFNVDDSPCVIDLVGAPSFSDTCGPDNEKLTVPEDTATIDWNSDEVDGVITVTATAKPGYAFREGGPVTWSFPYSDAECIEPSLRVSLLTGLCVADAPWIFYDIELIDPDAQSTGDVATLVLTDGVNTEKLELGKLEDGKLADKVLWPGASVAADGVTPTGWPGWALVGTTWVQVDDNFAWTRGDIDATIEVNPTVSVALSYPPVSPDCAAGPKGSGSGGSTPAASGTDLASTGFEGTTIAIVAGIVVVAGIAFVVIARIRRKRA